MSRVRVRGQPRCMRRPERQSGFLLGLFCSSEGDRLGQCRHATVTRALVSSPSPSPSRSPSRSRRTRDSTREINSHCQDVIFRRTLCS